MGEVQIVEKGGSPSAPLRIAVFFSGSGTGMNALLIHQSRDECIHRTVVCFTDKENAEEYAEEEGIATEAVTESSAFKMGSIADRFKALM